MLTIISTLFTDCGNGVADDQKFGVRLVDLYDKTHIDHWDSVPEQSMNVIKKCICDNKNTTSVINMFRRIKESSGSIMVGSALYKWEEIKHLFV